MSLIQQIHIDQAIAGTPRDAAVKLIDHAGQHLGSLTVPQATAIIATGLCAVGGSRNRIKYLRYNAPVVMPTKAEPICAVRHRPQYHAWHQERAVLQPGLDWINSVSGLSFGMG